jgi:hypothetical protein
MSRLPVPTRRANVWAETRTKRDGAVPPGHEAPKFRCDVAPKRCALVQNRSLPVSALKRPVAKWPHCTFERRSDRFGSRRIPIGSEGNSSAVPSTRDGAVPPGRGRLQLRCDVAPNRSVLVQNPALPGIVLSRLNPAGTVHSLPCHEIPVLFTPLSCQNG